MSLANILPPTIWVESVTYHPANRNVLERQCPVANVDIEGHVLWDLVRRSHDAWEFSR